MRSARAGRGLFSRAVEAVAIEDRRLLPYRLQNHTKARGGTVLRLFLLKPQVIPARCTSSCFRRQSAIALGRIGRTKPTVVLPALLETLKADGWLRLRFLRSRFRC